MEVGPGRPVYNARAGSYLRVVRILADGTQEFTLKMKLYIKPGSCSLASHIVLNEIGAMFEIEEVDTAAARTKTGTDYTTVNPNGYVPALEIASGDILVENPAILQYLADRNADRGLAPPNGTLERTQLQALLNFVASELHKAFGPFFSGDPLTPAQKEKAEAKVARRLGYLEGLLGDERAYLTGDVFSVADAYAFVVCSWVPNIGLDLTRWPHVNAYVDRVMQRPAVRKSMVTEGLIAS